MPRKTSSSMNPGEAAALVAAVYDLNEKATKQLLYGIIKVLTHQSGVMVGEFREILDDARKYSEIK